MMTRRSFAAALSTAVAAALAAASGGCGSGGSTSPGDLTAAEKKAQDAMRDMMTRKTAARRGRSRRR